MLTDAERAYLREVRERYCVPRKCDCIRECYRAFGRWWPEKAACCTHPGWSRVKDEKDVKR